MGPDRWPGLIREPGSGLIREPGSRDVLEKRMPGAASTGDQAGQGMESGANL